MGKSKGNNKLVAVIMIGAIVLAAVTVFAVTSMKGSSKSEYDKYATDDYVKLGQYKGLEYEDEKIKVSKDEIDERINSELTAHATTKEVKKGEVKDNETVVITYEATVDGKKVDEEGGANVPVTIGSGAFIDGFEKGLIGKKVGDSVKLELKYPEDYQNKDVAGKKVTYKVDINSKQITDAPKYDLEYIKNNTQFKTQEEYEDYIKDLLKKEKKETAKYNVRTNLLSNAVNNSEIVKYPKDLLKKQEDKIMQQYKDMAAQYDTSWEDFLKNYIKTSEKELKESIRTSAESQVKTMLVCSAIADKENISVSDKEYRKYLATLLENAGMTEESFGEQNNMSFEEYADQNGFREQYIQDKVMDYLYKNAKVKKEKK